MERKILVAIDGSVFSSNSIAYLGRLFHGQDNISLHLFSAIPAGPLPMGHELLEETDLLTTIGPEVQRKFAAARQYIDNTRNRLTRTGMKPERLTSDIQLSRQAVAHNIIHEARHGLYDALVVGRRGLTKIEELIMGSVSKTVLEKCHYTPIWVIDGHITSDKFLVPVDGTVHTLRAVDHLAFIMQGNPSIDITLFHSNAMFAGKPEPDIRQFHAQWDPHWCNEHIRADDIFHAPEQILRENGFAADKIHRYKTNIGMYVSRQILRQALIDDFGTIVMGRRAEDVKKGIFGSTSGKVAAMIENEALWLVG
jgi:nucleotide-binding universal stress UspA family protein